MNKKIGSLAGMCLLAALAAPAVGAATLGFTPSISSVTVGDAFSVEVRIADVADLYAFQFDFAFDPAIVRVDAISEGPFLADWGNGLSPPAGTFWDPGLVDNVAGSVSFVSNVLLGAIAPGEGATGSGVLASIQFTALASGTGTLTLLNELLVDSILDPIGAQLQGARVVVEAPGQVPEPAAALLMLCGLAGAAWSRARAAQPRRQSVRPPG